MSLKKIGLDLIELMFGKISNHPDFRLGHLAGNNPKLLKRSHDWREARLWPFLEYLGLEV